MTAAPKADRPHMPGYGVRPASEGTGLLPWAWAEKRLADSHDYWLATTGPNGEPHLMPVWAVWMTDALWFSCSNDSRKTRNLRADGRCSLATDDPTAPVVAQGVAELVADAGDLRKLLDAENTKYGTDYGIEMLDPTLNTCFKVRPTKVIGLEVADFTGSPTRWIPA